MPFDTGRHAHGHASRGSINYDKNYALQILIQAAIQPAYKIPWNAIVVQNKSDPQSNITTTEK